MEKKSHLLKGIDFREIFFLGWQIAMSIHYLSPLSEYWKDYYMLGIPEFAKVTPRGRLLDINIYLHLNDNSYAVFTLELFTAVAKFINLGKIFVSVNDS